MVDVTDGEYAGPMTLEQALAQLDYRSDIHETYAELLASGDERYISFGSEKFHNWAINGYDWMKYYMRANVVYREPTVSEAIGVIIKFIGRRFIK